MGMVLFQSTPDLLQEENPQCGRWWEHLYWLNQLQQLDLEFMLLYQGASTSALLITLGPFFVTGVPYTLQDG